MNTDILACPNLTCQPDTCILGAQHAIAKGFSSTINITNIKIPLIRRIWPLTEESSTGTQPVVARAVPAGLPHGHGAGPPPRHAAAAAPDATPRLPTAGPAPAAGHAFGGTATQPRLWGPTDAGLLQCTPGGMSLDGWQGGGGGGVCDLSPGVANPQQVQSWVCDGWIDGRMKERVAQSCVDSLLGASSKSSSRRGEVLAWNTCCCLLLSSI